MRRKSGLLPHVEGHGIGSHCRCFLLMCGSTFSKPNQALIPTLLRCYKRQPADSGRELQHALRRWTMPRQCRVDRCSDVRKSKADLHKRGIVAPDLLGLRLGEIRGLCVEDDEGHVLNNRRSVSRTIVKDTKAGEGEEDPAVVPIIGPPRLLLDRVKLVCGWLFQTRSVRHSICTTSLSG